MRVCVATGIGKKYRNDNNNSNQNLDDDDVGELIRKDCIILLNKKEEKDSRLSVGVDFVNELRKHHEKIGFKGVSHVNLACVGYLIVCMALGSCEKPIRMDTNGVEREYHEACL